MNLIEVGYVANIPYYLAYGFKKLGRRAVLFLPVDISVTYMPLFYGYPINGNPLSVQIHYYKGIDELYQMIIAFLSKERNKDWVIHLNIGASLKVLHLASRLLRVRNIRKVFVEFHGSDLRDMNRLKKLVFRLAKTSNKDLLYLCSTPDLLYYGLPCLYLPNPVDPLFLSNIGKLHRIVSKENKKVLIPARIDENKNIHIFIYRLYQALRGGYLDPRDLKIEIIIWGRRPYIEFVKMILRRFAYLGVEVVLHNKLLRRSEILWKMLNSDIVIGQFKLGIISQIELEALALNKLVIARLNKDLYLKHEGVIPPIINYDPQYDEDGKQLADILLATPDISPYGYQYVVRKHLAEKSALLLASLLD
ncbi:MAG: hypothetical protein QXP98_04000 [Thermoproteus sp.]